MRTERKQKLTQCAVRVSWDSSRKIRLRRQFHERFISLPTSSRRKTIERSGNFFDSNFFVFSFPIFLSAARLTSDRLIAALHKPAGTSCREKVANKNVN